MVTAEKAVKKMKGLSTLEVWGFLGGLNSNISSSYFCDIAIYCLFFLAFIFVECL